MAKSTSEAPAHFNIHLGSTEKRLKAKKYHSIDAMKKDAFALFLTPETGGGGGESMKNFHDENAILTYLDKKKTETLLDFIPDLSKNNDPKDLFIRFVSLGCAMCLNPLGIVDNQRILQCSDIKCATQYCNSCVQAIRGLDSQCPFVCMVCRKEVIPTFNPAIEEHIIWRNMSKSYGNQEMDDLKEASKDKFGHPIRKSIGLRLIHLKSRLQIIQSSVDANDNQRAEENLNSSDQQLIVEVNRLCAQLENLTERLRETQEEMDRHGIIVQKCLDGYRKLMKHFHNLCDTSTANITASTTANPSDLSDARKEQIRQAYRMPELENLSGEQNILSIEHILEDIEFRERCLLGSKVTILASQNLPQQNPSVLDHLGKIEKKLQKLTNIKQELDCLHGSLKALKDYIDEYDALLRDQQYPEISCSKFILLMERMRVRTDEIDISNNFRNTDVLMRTWKNDQGAEDQFKPKVSELCKKLEADLQHLFRDYNWVYSLPYKIGVIGHGSVGKSALIMNLAELQIFSEMIDFERSTFGYLQFDTRVYKDPETGRIIPISFIDIEGATDVNQSQTSGNYLELIKKADCDLYLVIFDDLFSEHNRICQNFIEKELKRKCILVRNRADTLFNECFRQLYGKKYQTTSTSAYQTTMVLNHIKDHALKTFDEKRLESGSVHLIASVCDENVRGASFAEFDRTTLTKKLIEAAKTDVRTERICHLAIRSAVGVINTCFRRGYVVSQTRYKWLSAGASIVPFLNELAAFLGREKIRQVFGIHDNSSLTNWTYGTRNSLEEYLTVKKVKVPKEALKSGEFGYLIDGNSSGSKASSGWKSYILGMMPILIGNAGFIAATLGDDVAAVGLRTVSVVGIVANIVLTPIFAAWSFHSTGKEMNKELHSICDDLVVIFGYFIINRCDEFCRNIQPLPPPPANADSSSDSDDD